MEKITCFRTSGGQLFEDEISACQHEDRLSFRSWYERNKLYVPFGGSSVGASEIKSRLTKNAEELRAFLEAL